GVDNRRITLIVIRARANSAVVVSLMEFVLVVLMEMEIKSIFQLRTLLINLQFIYPEPDYSLDFNSPQDLHNLQQQNLCCENCRGPHATIECQPMSQDSHSFGFDQLQTPQFSVNHRPPQPMSMEALQAQEDLMKSIESFLKKFNRISFGKTPKVLLQAWDNFFEVKHAQSEEVQELLSKLVQDVKIISDELSEYINTLAWNRPLVYCDNDDDEDYTIAITPESPTKEPVNSLSLGDEHLDTIPATESDEFIKSSVENLVPTPIEFEDFSDDECDLPPYDDSSKNHDFTFSNPLFDIDEDFTLSDESFSEEDIPKENFIIFSNPLFDLDEEIASTKVDRINDEVLEGIHSIPPGIDSFDAESDLVESVLNRDISIDSSPKIDSLSNEFAGELILPKSIPPEIEEVEFDPEGDILFLESLLYDNSSPRPPEALQANSNAIESLPPSHIPVADNDSLMEEIDLFLADDGSIPPGIESDDVDSVDDDTSISLPEFESFYVDYPNSGNSTIDVVEDIPVDVPNVLPTHPILEQDFIPTSEFFAYVVWIFLPFLAYPVIPPSLLSCGDEDTIFDPGISKFIYPEPDYSLDFNSPQDLHNLQQQNLCCENCRGPHATIECQPMSQNSHSFGFDQLQTPQFSVNHQPPQPMSMEALQAQEDLMKSIESFLKKFNRISFGKTPKVLLQAWDNFFEVKHAQSEEVQELLSKLVQDVKIISDELSEYINTPAWNRPLVYCDNDDDEDYTIAITPESPTKEPVNSLSLGDEHLDTIPATESDEFIKSSVENLVPTPIEFEDFSDDECDLPPYDDSSKNHDFTFSNPLFDIDEDFTLSDESFSEEDIPKENFIIFSNPLFDLDEEIASTKVDRINDEVLEGIHSIPPGIDSFDAESDLVESVLNRDISIDSSPKIDSLSNEFAGELILPKSIPPEIEEVEFDPEGDILFLESLLYDNSSPRPLEALQANSNAIESLPPSHIPVTDNDSLMEEIDLFLADDGSIPPGIESDDVDSVDDDTSISLPEFESFYVDYPNSGNSTIDVVEDIPVDVPNVLPTHPILEQDFIPTSEFFAYVVWIFLPFLAYPVIPPSLLSCGDEDTIFDPGISIYHSSFMPDDCPDCEDSQFCHSSRVSHPQLHLGIRYPNLID
ncbi:hypothetical protein Tco_0060763, partial [Tanacetum coccineum]